MNHATYLSPFSWRYASAAMRALWSERHRRATMRQVWLALAEAQHQAGLIGVAEIDALRATADDIDIERAQHIEQRTRHDVMAEVLAWAEQAPAAGGVLHLGATSADITDNADALRLRDGMALLRAALVEVVRALAGRVQAHADLVTLGWTHLQPAAPTTVGYRLAVHLQDFMTDLQMLDWVTERVRGKGFKGAVGSAASYEAVLRGTGMSAAQMEQLALERLGLPAVPIANQVYPRKQDWLVANAIAGIAGSASTFAFNLRLLQSPPFGEWFEGFAADQVGSTAMPWKRNPINAENVNSLARYVASLPEVAWHNAAVNLLERTLDDSANRRIILPELFLAGDEILRRTLSLADSFRVDENAVQRTLERFGPFAATEHVLLAAAAKGADRQALHERIRRHSLEAWRVIESGAANPLAELLAADDDIGSWLEPDVIRALVADPAQHVGDAAQRARGAAQAALDQIASP